jgi:hypothetical protein
MLRKSPRDVSETSRQKTIQIYTIMRCLLFLRILYSQFVILLHDRLIESLNKQPTFKQLGFVMLF